MKQFVQKVLVMVGLVLVSSAAVVWLVPPDRDDYLAVIGDKMAMLDAMQSPKMVFVGGSNLAFGLDSERIERRTGYRVANMGMGFNMGLRFMLDLMLPRIGEGDLVVLVPEYNLFFGLFDGDERLIDVLELYPEGIGYLRSPQQYYILARNLPRHVKFKLNRYLATLGREPDPNCIYCPQAFNERGDVVRHLDEPSKDVASMSFLRRGTKVDGTAIAEINAFAAKVAERGARAVLLFPCIPDVHYDQRKDGIERLYERLASELEIPVLARPADYAFPVDHFYDWVYHLNRHGREVRTDRVISDLETTISWNGTPPEPTGPQGG